jgi:hypothetical protein
MAINHRSSIRSQTNFKGAWVDAEEFQEARASIEHSSPPQNTCPWATTYVETLPEPVPSDPSLEAANTTELRNRNLLHIKK